MKRTTSLIGKLLFIGICAATLAGCYYGPGPGYYGPAYYGPPPVTGEVVVEGGGYHHWR